MKGSAVARGRLGVERVEELLDHCWFVYLLGNQSLGVSSVPALSVTFEPLPTLSQVTNLYFVVNILHFFHHQIWQLQPPRGSGPLKV